MKIFFIVNPVAGRRKNILRLVQKIRRVASEMKTEVTVRLWEFPDQITTLVQDAISQGAERIIAVGGDGTVNAIGKLLIGTDIAMGIVPSGSGNGFAHHLGYSRNLERAIRQNFTGRIERVDTGVFGGIPFLNSAGIGIDAEVAHNFSGSKKRGLRTYIRKSTEAFMKFRSFPLTIEVDGKRQHWNKVYFVDIANGTEWGSGAKISPRSCITDGSFTSVVVPRTGIARVPVLLNRLFNGTLDRSRS